MTYGGSNQPRPSRNERREAAREKARLLREEQKKRERRNKILIQGGIIVAVGGPQVKAAGAGAAKYPGVQFVVVGAPPVPAGPNLAGAQADASSVAERVRPLVR